MKKLTLLFALLCASVMGWSTRYCGETITATNGVNTAVLTCTHPSENLYVMQITSDNANFTGLRGDNMYCYINGDNTNYHMTDNYTYENGIVTFNITSTATPVMHTPLYLNMNDEITFTTIQGQSFEWPADCSGSSEPAVTGICATETYASDVEGYAIHAQVTKTCNKYFLTISSATEGKTIAGLNGDNMFCYRYSDATRSYVDGYHMAASGHYTIEGGNVIFTIPSAGDPQMYTNLSVRFSDNQTCNIAGLNGVRLEPCSSESEPTCPDPDPTEIEDVNFALISNGAIAYATSNNPWGAIDNNNGSRWESAHKSDPQDYIIDLGQRRIFNTIQIRWEGAYAKAFTIDVSNDGENWTNKVTETAYVGGNDVEYEAALGSNVTARYVKFHGTERAETNYGYSFYEFRVLLKGTPVLTTLNLSSDKDIVKIGEYTTLTATTLDQNNGAIAASLSYAVSPTTAGHVTDGKYYPDQYGDATITVTATAGGVNLNKSIHVWGATSDNIAFNKTITDWIGCSTEPAERAIDGNMDNLWSCGLTGVGDNPCNNTGDARDYDAYFVVDLGGYYDINLIRINFEGACSQNYTIQFSKDNSAWSIGKNYEHGSAVQEARVDTWDVDDLSNKTDIRYVKFHSTKAATPYRVKIHEMRVYGDAHVDANVNVSNITLSQTAATVEVGESLTLTATVEPYNATDKALVWTSTDESVATVEDGVITTHTAGTTTIRATAHDGSGQYDECALTVNPITAKTYWGTYTVESWDNMPLLWSVTRNANKTLTYTVYYGGDASGYVVRQLNDGDWNDLTGYTDENRVASYTTAATYEKGDQLSPNPFFYFGGPRIDLPTSYRVGDSNDKPATSVSSVSLNYTAASLEPTEQLQLTASILPSFVENKAVTWTSSNSDIASVTDDGLVTANAVGTATITATSSADNTKKATCTITVVGDLNPETLYGYGKFNVHGKWVAFNYSITRTAERNLYYQTHLSEDIAGIAMKINYNDNWYTMTQDDSKRNATYTENGPFVDGNAHNFYFRAEFTNGADNNNVTYTIASSNDALPQAIAVDEDKDNEAVLDAYDGQTVIGIVGRSFTAGNLYTLVLPFDVDAAQTAAILPGQLTKLNNSYFKDNGDMRVNFVDVDAIEAGVPYLYAPSADVTNPVFAGVTVEKDLDPTEPADGLAKYYGIYAPMNGEGIHAITHGYVLGSDQYLYSVADLPESQTMKALRGYFVLNFPGAASAPKHIAKVVFNSTETENATALEELQINPSQCTKIMLNGLLYIVREGKIYNLQGQLVK